MTKYYYELYGLVFESEFEIPFLQVIDSKPFDIQIKVGENPAHLPLAERRGILFEATNNDFVFRKNNVGSFRVQDGTSITVQADADISINEITVFLLGSALGALFQQRGLLSLHGSSVLIDGKAYLFIGDSSVGKSSIAAGFVVDGNSVLSDDISVLQKKNDYYYVQPGLPYLKLWADVANSLGFPADLPKVRSNLNKYRLPLVSKFESTPHKLGSIICLEKKNTLGFQHEEIFGTTKFDLLISHLYRNQYINGDSAIKNYFSQITDIITNTDVFKLMRPESPLLIKELVQYVKNNILTPD